MNYTLLGRVRTVSDLAFLDTSFGLSYIVDEHSTTTPVTGLPTDPVHGLPIVDLTATDPDGATHTFDFVLGNLSRTFNQLKIEATVETNIAELEIYDMMNGVNIALNGTASSTNAHTVGPPSNANDGNTDSISTSLAISMVLGGLSTWILDLDREYSLKELNRVLFCNRGATRPDLDLDGKGATISLHSSNGGDPV